MIIPFIFYFTLFVCSLHSVTLQHQLPTSSHPLWHIQHNTYPSIWCSAPSHSLHVSMHTATVDQYYLTAAIATLTLSVAAFILHAEVIISLFKVPHVFLHTTVD